MLQPAKVRDRSLDDLTDANRLRLVHSLITALPSEGGAGIYPDEASFVEGILPLHDQDFNKVTAPSNPSRLIVHFVRGTYYANNNWLLFSLNSLGSNHGRPGGG